ncbi:unnamed protein product [Orchesella dallaii]|uniref:Odorant receptor n=1 Tax=Orchesella dallaii TaxID=48710 RepID=A0ABP1Q4L0_9HEXA
MAIETNHPIMDTDIMLNQHYLNLSKYLLKVTSTLGFCPIYADTKLGKIRINNWSWARSIHSWMWLLTYGTIVVPTHLFEIYMARKGLEKLRSNPMAIYLFLGIIFCWMFTLFLGAYTFKPLAVSQYMNAFYKYLETFPAKYICRYDAAKEKRRRILLEFLLNNSTLFHFGVVTLSLIHCFLHPNAPSYPTFRVPPYLLSFPVRLASAGWFGVFALNFHILAVIFFNLQLLYYFTIFCIIKDELRLGKAEYRTRDLLRKPNHLVANYRAIEILLKILNVEVGMIFVPIQYCLILAILLCNVSLAFQWNMFKVITRMFLAGIMILLLGSWLIILLLGGWHYQESEKTVESWKLDLFARRADRMYMKRVKLTCRPISYGDGKRYLMTPSQLLHFMETVGRETFVAFSTYSGFFGY